MSEERPAKYPGLFDEVEKFLAKVPAEEAAVLLRWPVVAGWFAHLDHCMRIPMAEPMLRSSGSDSLIKRLKQAQQAFATAPRVPGTELRIVANPPIDPAEHQKRLAEDLKRVGLIDPEAHRSILAHEKVVWLFERPTQPTARKLYGEFSDYHPGAIRLAVPFSRSGLWASAVWNHEHLHHLWSRAHPDRAVARRPQQKLPKGKEYDSPVTEDRRPASYLSEVNSWLGHLTFMTNGLAKGFAARERVPDMVEQLRQDLQEVEQTLRAVESPRAQKMLTLEGQKLTRELRQRFGKARMKLSILGIAATGLKDE